MRATLAAIVLAIASGFLGWVYGGRARMANPGPTSYQAALYSLHVRAVAATTGEPLHFDFQWPKDEVSPFGKGSGPVKIQVLADGSKILNVVGLELPQGLKVRIQSKGYADVEIPLMGSRGGISTDGPDRIQTVTMTPEPGTPTPAAKQ